MSGNDDQEEEESKYRADDVPRPPLDLKELQEQLWERAKVHVNDDDPLMAQIHAQILFVEELEHQLSTHDKKLEGIIDGAADKTAEAVEKCLDVLKSETLDSSMQQTLARFEEEAKFRYMQMMASTSIKWLLVINIIFLIVTIWALKG